MASDHGLYPWMVNSQSQAPIIFTVMGVDGFDAVMSARATALFGA